MTFALRFGFSPKLAALISKSRKFKNHLLPVVPIFILRPCSTMTGKGGTNRLINEKSPYLLQHAQNPVNWYPWGEEAFNKAKEENKPIFLSVGYSTCHWCHVMEHESFENEMIAQCLNQDFVSIKVDREERPDVDNVYMTFVQVTSGHGGWPMSVFLTPKLEPFFGGTYFPPTDTFGRPGFATVLSSIALQWKSESDKIKESGSKIIKAIRESVMTQRSSGELPNASECFQKLYKQFRQNFDSEKGGFGRAPKFPQPVNLEFLLCYSRLCKDSADSASALGITKKTLDKMGDGGIHDHISQGFHRYSTDGDWHVPHFEKMLYDQGQLLSVYADFYKLKREEKYASIIYDIVEYVNRDLSHKDGGFFSAEDADSYPEEGSVDKKEGAFCVWSAKELKALLDNKVDHKENSPLLFDLFAYHFGVKDDGNVNPSQDPHGELKNKNVLIIRNCIDEVATHFNISIPLVEESISKCNKILFDARGKRPRPHLDTKMIVAWNGLMISGLCKAADATGNQSFYKRAIEAALFVKTSLTDAYGNLLRSVYADEKHSAISQLEKPISGFSSDYSFLIRSLLDLYQSCFDVQWLLWAQELQDRQIKLFWDDEGSGFFENDADDSSVLLRMKQAQDGAEPSSNSIAASNLLRLASFFDRPNWTEKALCIFKLNAETMNESPMAFPGMMTSFYLYHNTIKQVVLIGDKEDEAARSILNLLHTTFTPNQSIIFKNGNDDTSLSGLHKYISELKTIDGKATVYICENYTCSLPLTTLEDIKSALEA